MGSTKLKTLAILTIVTACAPVGHKFCVGSGLSKGSAQYEQCTANYKANQELYEYCQNSKGITQQGPQMGQCLESARQMRDIYNQNVNSCQSDAMRKYSSIFSKPRMEKQPTLNPNGLVSVSDVPVGDYSIDDKNAITAPFMQQCMQTYGWNGAWKAGQTPVSISSTTSALSALNKQPIAINVPVSPTIKLFQMVSEGNVYGVKSIFDSREMPVNIQNYQGYTALHVAAKQGNFQIVQMLIEEFHADTELRSFNGEKAIDMAAQGPNRNLVGYISDVLRKRDAERIRAEEEERRRRDIERLEQKIEERNNTYYKKSSQSIGLKSLKQLSSL
ncbi:MAG: Ankyrin repeat (many copies) [Rickettsiaceae bacterium]|jgi:hypothetical protein|nr:Ankyrin repeat (many copies) [Rickettsiaceae bacterium]